MAEHKPRILFVEDNIGKRYVIARQLRAEGFEIDEAESGEQALALLSPKHDVAILDIKLPDMMGWDLCQRIKTRPDTASIKVLELSATLAAAEDRARGLDLGADCYLVHPVEMVELIAALRALFRLRQAERDRTRAQELLLASLGHDLRNPLSTLAMGLQVLDVSPNLTADDRTTIERMGRTIGRMKRMVEQLMVFAQSMSSELAITREPVDFGEICRLVVRDAVQRTDRPIEAHCAPGLELSGDDDKLTQVVENLIANAIRHGEGPIVVHAAREGDCVLLTVHNGGKPIRAEALDTLFEPFTRAGGGAGGVGLGLYIVDQIVRAHGGSAAVASSADAGTTFTVRLPI